MYTVVGIDEVGRGPVAGPVAVGAFAYTSDFTINTYPDVRDSKKHTCIQRNTIYEYLLTEQEKGRVDFHVGFASVTCIEQKGIVAAIRKALDKALHALTLDPVKVRVLLDGGLVAPTQYRNQTTIIRGDATERVISYASIVAKVERDRYMERVDKKYPRYGFAQHKGYGTRAHFDAIRRYGAAPIHRRSFLTNVLPK